MPDDVIVVDPPAPAGAPAPLVIPAADWRAGLPDDLKAEQSLGRYKGVDELARGYLNAEKAISGSVRLPPKDAKPEDLAKWKAETLPKLAGLVEAPPESPEKYAIQRPEIALDVPWDDAAEKGFLAAMHKAGASNAAAQAAISYYGEMITRQVLAAHDQAKNVEGELRQEWGANYDAHLGRANRAIQQFGGPDLIDLYAKTGMGRHPLNIKAWVAIGNTLVEHGALPAGGEAGVSAGDAKARMTAMFADAKHPYNNKNHPDHMAAIDEYLMLNRIVQQGRG